MQPSVFPCYCFSFRVVQPYLIANYNSNCYLSLILEKVYSIVLPNLSTFFDN